MLRRVAITAGLILSLAAAASGQNQKTPVVCVSAVADATDKAIGPLGNLNDELAKEISERRKPLQGLAVAADVTGEARPAPACDYLLVITLHLGSSTGIAFNPPRPNPLEPGNDPRRTTSEWLVRAFYRLTSTPNAGTTVKFEDDVKDQYEPEAGGYGTDVGSVARRLAHAAAYNATGNLKKKLKL